MRERRPPHSTNEKRMSLQHYIRLILWVMVLILLGSGMGVWTGSDASLWYNGLNRSVLTPPSVVFPVVWTVLYALIGVCGWLIWRGTFRTQKIVKMVYMLQLVLNWMWTPLFFHYHWVGGALAVAIMLAFTIGIVMVLAPRLVSVLMAPYLGWVLFAVYLNVYIWWYN
ncbi:MAG: tryptophan-rich sensory protein [Alphaproteobacteria bacterium]|nr:tryptophan-rich sensory protein [Alphaproteobacteria bacterium]